MSPNYPCFNILRGDIKSPKPMGSIFRESLMPVPNFTTIDPAVVELFQSGPSVGPPIRQKYCHREKYTIGREIDVVYPFFSVIILHIQYVKNNYSTLTESAPCNYHHTVK